MRLRLGGTGIRLVHHEDTGVVRGLQNIEASISCFVDRRHMVQFRGGNKVLDVLRLHFNLDQCDMHFLPLEFSLKRLIVEAPTRR